MADIRTPAIAEEPNGTDALAEFRRNHQTYKFKETPKAVRILFIFLKYLVLITGCLLVILPLLVVLLGAFKTHDEYITTNVFAFPADPQWSNFVTAFMDGDVLRGLLNTAIILIVTAIQKAIFREDK